MPYTWNSLQLDVPPGVVDQTIVTFVESADPPSFTVTISRDQRGGQAFAGYVEGQLVDLAKSLPGYASSAREDQQVNGRPAVVVEHKARSPQGQSMRQRQAYVDLESGVAIVAVTWPDKSNPKAREAFDHIYKSLR
jgi:hypothetical protein